MIIFLINKKLEMKIVAAMQAVLKKLKTVEK